MPEHDGGGDGLLLRARPRAENARRAGVAEREQEQHHEHGGRIPPVHSEEHPAHQEQAGGLSGRHHQARHRLGRHHRSAQDRCRSQAPQHPDPTRLDQARREQQHRDAEEEHQVGGGDVGERADGRGNVRVGQREVGDRGPGPLGRHEIEQRHDVGARLHGAGVGALGHQIRHAHGLARPATSPGRPPPGRGGCRRRGWPGSSRGVPSGHPCGSPAGPGAPAGGPGRPARGGCRPGAR